ncbi:MAG: Cof-type HAD-IIB family hydrolase [Candidatus Izemoplasmatales bacterium]|uniref:HAD family hydrolase n=1 Tax=Hujiaoplasma nucleasis TaxID=2725268 RepID=A0A7L6N582_9MOLU|nr:Cof-type HAD-IIB family hydrolase [Hujiaoplasma nucleasis]QLY40398.1 HAD family hydrolase [Hujiaoplasma nucleasis]
MALIFFDLDGTILVNGQVVPGIFETLKALREKGHYLSIATGRNPNLLKGIEKKLEFNHMVLANGGYVISHGKVVYENYISLDTVKRITKKADEMAFDLTIEYIDEYVNYRQDTNKALEFSKHFDLPIATYNPNIYPDRDVFAMVVYEDEVVDKIKGDFPELQFNKSGGIAYDVNPKGDLKAEGVKALIKHLGFDIKDTYAFGDNYNDMSMFKAVGHPIAMGNAVKALKDIAEFVTDDVDKAGIEKALKKYKLL